MTHSSKRLIRAAAIAAVIGVPSLAAAQAAAPMGVWIDHTGRGAVEITECGANLCGRAVWIKDPKDSKGCGIQIIGNAKPVAGGKWDNGWIYDPDEDAKYSVELTPLPGDKLKVLGYSGSKFFSETMIWKRAPADLKRCDQTAAVTPTAPVATEKSDAQTEAKTVASAPPVVVPEEKAQSTQTTQAQAADPVEEKPSGPKRKKDCQFEIANILIKFPCPQ
ncbi:MAG: DUF2147 domain-containing protein [Hyphomicrobiaceae bacterium]